MLAHGSECLAQRVSVGRHVGLAFDRAFYERDGILILTYLMRDPAQEIPSVGLIGVTHKDIPIQRLRLLQPAGFVVFKGSSEFRHSMTGQ